LSAKGGLMVGTIMWELSPAGAKESSSLYKNYKVCQGVRKILSVGELIWLYLDHL